MRIAPVTRDLSAVQNRKSARPHRAKILGSASGHLMNPSSKRGGQKLNGTIFAGGGLGEAVPRREFHRTLKVGGRPLLRRSIRTAEAHPLREREAPRSTRGPSSAMTPLNTGFFEVWGDGNRP